MLWSASHFLQLPFANDSYLHASTKTALIMCMHTWLSKAIFNLLPGVDKKETSLGAGNGSNGLQSHDKVYTKIEHMVNHFCNQLVLDFIP